MATYFSNRTGNWTSASTWLTAAAGTFTPTGSAGTPPQSFGYDKIFIRKNHVVTYDTSGVFGDGGTGLVGNNVNITSSSIILSGGTLRASRTQNTALTALGVIWVASGSTATDNGSFWDWGTLNDPISAVTSTISMSGIAAGQSGFYAQQNGSFTSSNSACFCGLEKTRNTFLTLSANTAQNKITVDSCRNWSVGDTIVIESDTTSTIRTLTGAKIQSIAGNEITLDTNVNFARLSGTRVGNFTSTVTYKTLESSLLAFGIACMGTPNSTFQVSYISVENINDTGWRIGPGAGVGFPAGAVYMHTEFQRRVPIFRGVAYQHTDPVNFASHLFAAKFITDSELIIDDCAANVQRQTTLGNVFNLQTNTFVRVKNSVVYKAARIINPGALYKVTFDDCYLNSDLQISTDVAVGNSVQFNRCRLRTNGPLVALANISSLKFNNCNIATLFSSAMFSNAFNSFGEYSLLNCTLNNTALSAYAFSTTTNKTLNDAGVAINVFNPNNNNTFTNFNYYYHSTPSSSIRKNGITSLSFRPKVPNTAFSKTFTVPAVEGVTQKIKGNLRFDTNYGTTTPPSISFSGAVASTTFTSPASANTWNSFEYDLTPTYTGDIEILLTGISTLSTGFVYLDGLIFDPFIKDVRWYGFEFDKNFYRTADTLTTLTENQASSVDITNLDRLYDASNYWTINNPLSTSYLDLYTRNGDILNFGNRNIVFNNSASTNVAYSSASNTVTIKTPLLSSGNNFIGLRTTGTITVSANSSFSYIDIYGNISQQTPVSLSGVYMEGTLSYNTGVDTAIEYIDCTMDTVQNLSDGLVTIKKTNSTITNGNDPEILDFVPTLLDIQNLNGGYIAIFDDTGTRRYYQNSNEEIVLPFDAQGTWRYHIARYGYIFIQDNFLVAGGTITINPDYIADTFVDSNAATVAAYTDLDTVQKIYNYLNYYTTTSDGIEYDPFYSRAFGSLTINKNVNLDRTAASILTYNGSTLLTLKCTGLSEEILFASNGNIIAQNGTTYSDDVKIRAANLDSELILGGITSLTLYPTPEDRDNNTDAGEILTGTIYRFLYGSTTPLGVLLEDFLYSRINITGSILLNDAAIVQGTNELDFGTTGTLQQIINNQKVINVGVQKASKLIPHTTNI
jgi:hypothetical protein